jgi:hypothetical protein
MEQVPQAPHIRRLDGVVRMFGGRGSAIWAGKGYRSDRTHERVPDRLKMNASTYGTELLPWH